MFSTVTHQPSAGRAEWGTRHRFQSQAIWSIRKRLQAIVSDRKRLEAIANDWKRLLAIANDWKRFLAIVSDWKRLHLLLCIDYIALQTRYCIAVAPRRIFYYNKSYAQIYPKTRTNDLTSSLLNGDGGNDLKTRSKSFIKEFKEKSLVQKPNENNLKVHL